MHEYVAEILGGISPVNVGIAEVRPYPKLPDPRDSVVGRYLG